MIKTKKAFAVMFTLCTAMLFCMTAFADENFDSLTGTLTLSKNVDKESVMEYAKKDEVKKVTALESTVFPQDCSYMFFKFCAESIDLSKADTSAVTDMSYMFSDCDKLNSVELDGFDTSKVTDMRYMFNSCYALSSLDLKSFDTGSVKKMNFMFADMHTLEELDLTGFNTDSLTETDYMFSNCNALTKLDISNFNTKNVESMSGMFNQCNSLKSIDLSSFDTSNTVYMGSMFEGCEALEALDLKNFDTSKVTSMGSMFGSCESLTSLDLSNFDRRKASYDYMFDSCNSLVLLTVGEHFNNIKSSEWLSNGSYGWANANDPTKRISGTWSYAVITNTGKNTYMKLTRPIGSAGDCKWYFDSSSGILTVSGDGDMPEYSDSSRPEWYEFKDMIKKVVIIDGLTSIGAAAFSDCTDLKGVKIAESVTKIQTSAFDSCGMEYIILPKNTVIEPTGAGFAKNEKISGFIVCGYKNSNAETYAKANGFEFIILGDVENDGDVDIADAAVLLKYTNGTKPNLDSKQLIAAKISDSTKEMPDILDVIGLINII